MSTIIIATTGAYSDYTVNGTFNILRPFTLRQVQKEHRVHWILQHGGNEDPTPAALINYLIKAGYLEVADSEEIHFGDYDRINIAEPDREWKP